jgi:hypothetical protein
MNTQTLNRMIKASYSAPNGAQLRKACYGLLSVKSRRASLKSADGQLMEQMEQLQQLPQEEQAQVKAEIVKESLVVASKKAQQKGNQMGLLHIRNFLAKEGISLEEMADMVKEVKNQKELLNAARKVAKTDVEIIVLSGKIAKSFSFEEVADYLDIPIDWIQRQFQDTNYLKLVCLAVLVYTLVGIIFAGAGAALPVIVGAGGVALFALKGIGVAMIPLLLEFLLGNVGKWLQKRFGMLLGWVATIIPRAFALIVKGAGWLLDKFFSGVGSAFSSFFSRQAKIAMQSPQFRRAYYKLV